MKGTKISKVKNFTDFYLGEIDTSVKYWLRENLSALPIKDRYMYLLEYNEEVLIKSLKSILKEALNEAIKGWGHIKHKMLEKAYKEGFKKGKEAKREKYETTN